MVICMKKIKEYYYSTEIDSKLTEIIGEDASLIEYEALANGDFDKVKGVWALWGKSIATFEWKCLQVGETENIAREIRKAIRTMRLENLRDNQEYVNQWGEYVFSHPPNLKTAGMWAYEDIPKKYSGYVWILVGCSDDKSERRRLESYYAERYHAIYWRDGGGNQKNKQKK